MKNLHEILEIADRELGSIVQNGKFRSREEIHSAYELIDIAKDIYCIWNYEDESDMRGGSYNEGMSYDRDGRSYRVESYERDGYSGARGRNAKRDSMGRYSRDGSYRGSYRGYSRDGKEEYKEHLREMMEDAPSEEVRQNIQRMIDQL